VRVFGHADPKQTFPLSSGMTGFATGMVSFVARESGSSSRFLNGSAYGRADLRPGVKVSSWTAKMFVINITDACFHRTCFVLAS